MVTVPLHFPLIISHLILYPYAIFHIKFPLFYDDDTVHIWGFIPRGCCFLLLISILVSWGLLPQLPGLMTFPAGLQLSTLEPRFIVGLFVWLGVYFSTPFHSSSYRQTQYNILQFIVIFNFYFYRLLSYIFSWRVVVATECIKLLGAIFLFNSFYCRYIKNL